MWQLIGQTIWFFFPAGISNIGASLSGHLHLPAWTVDAGATLGGKPIFGAHKTWRGLIIGTISGTLFFWLQQYLYQFEAFQSVSIIDYSESSWVYGLLLSLGGVLGDLVKSFFKRRVSIRPGHPWIPFDQIDYVVGAVLLIAIIYFPGWGRIFIAMGLGFLLHIAFNLLGYILKLQKNKL